MKSIIRLAAALLLATTYAHAAGGTSVNGTGWLLSLFLAFGAIIIIFQLLPGIAQFTSILKTMFTSSAKNRSNVT